MVCLAAGRTTCAVFQNSASVGLASGSRSMARRICVSVRESRRFQSVLALAEGLPVNFSFIPLCSPRRNDPAFRLRHIGVNHCDLSAVHNSNGVHANLAVVEAVINSFHRASLEDPDRVLKHDSMKSNVAPVL